MTESHASRLLRSFGAGIGLPDIDFDEEGLCTLSFDDFLLTLERNATDESLMCCIWLAEIPVERRAEAALSIADANYLQIATAGATLGMNRQTGDVVLSVRLPTARLDLPGLERAFENLIDLAAHWRQRLAAERPAAAPVGVAPADFMALRA